MKTKNENNVITTTSVESKKMSDYNLKQIKSIIQVRDNNSNEIVCTIKDVVEYTVALSLIKCLIQTKIKKDKYSIKQLKRMFKKTHKSKFRFLVKRNKENTIEESVKIEVETKSDTSSNILIEHTIHIEIRILKHLKSLSLNQISSKDRMFKKRKEVINNKSINTIYRNNNKLITI